MTLERIIYPQGQVGNFGYDNMLQEDHIFGDFLEATNNNIYHHQISDACWGDYSSSSLVMHVNDRPEDCFGGDMKTGSPTTAVATTAVGRRKRRRQKSGKNEEELENQRLTHIVMERNRRKQMNDYLKIIRSLLPSSYVHRGDQASIVGGAINFVKELEKQLQTLEVQKRATINVYSPPSTPKPFGYFFTFPQYSTHRTSDKVGSSATIDENRLLAMADIEVTKVESQANIKILSKKQHSQLFKLLDGLQCFWLTILHLNVTTVEEMVLYTIIVKVLEDQCQLSTVDEIADAVNCLLCKIEEGSLYSN